MTDELKESIITTATTCQQEAGASDSDLEELMKRSPATTKTGKCMRKCIMDKFNMVRAQPLQYSSTESLIPYLYVQYSGFSLRTANWMSMLPKIGLKKRTLMIRLLSRWYVKLRRPVRASAIPMGIYRLHDRIIRKKRAY